MPRAVPGPGRARRFDDNCHLMMTLGELQRSTGEMWSDVGGSGVGQDVMGTMAFDLFEGEFRDIKVANTMHQGKTSQSALAPCLRDMLDTCATLVDERWVSWAEVTDRKPLFQLSLGNEYRTGFQIRTRLLRTPDPG